MYVFKKYRFLLKNTGLWASKYRFVFPEVGMSVYANHDLTDHIIFVCRLFLNFGNSAMYKRMGKHIVSGNFKAFQEDLIIPNHISCAFTAK